eukprot:2547247-Pyramimonas_sp.AAC.1
MVSLILEGEDDCHGPETMLNNYARDILAGRTPPNEMRTSARDLLVLGITKRDEGSPPEGPAGPGTSRCGSATSS